MQAICDAHVEALVLLDYVNNDVVVQRCEALMTLALHPLVNAISVFNAVLAVETRMASAQRKAGLLKKLLGLARVKQDVQLQCSIVTVAWQRLGEACSRKSAGLRYVCLEVLGELVKPVDAGGSGQLSRNDKTAGHMDSTAVTANDIRRLTLSFCDDTDARVRHTALNVASASYRRGVVMGIDVYQAAVHALDDASPEVRMQAINVVWVCANTSPDAKIDQGTETRMVDDAFAKICDLVNDVEVPVRERACQLLGSIHGVQDEIVLQTLDKNIMSHLRHAKTHEQKRNEARFGARCADYLVDMFNDEIDDVRLAAMHSLRLMISYTQFNSEHVDIMLGSLHEDNVLVRNAVLSELQRVSSLYSEHSQPCTHARVYRTFTKIAFGFLKLRRLLPEARDVAQRDTQNSADAATPTYTHTYTHTPTHTHTSTHTPTHTHTSTHTPTHTHTSTHTPTHTPRDTSTARATETGPSAEGDSGVRNQSHRIAGAPQLSAEARAALPSLSLLMLHQVARVCHTYLGVRESMQCGLDEMRLVWCGVYLVCVMEAHVPKGGVAGDGIVGGDAGYGHTTQSRVRAHTDTPAHPRESTHTHMCDLWEIVVAQAREWCERYDPPQTHKTVQEQTRLTRVSVKRPRTDSSAQALPTAATHDDRHTGHAAKGTHTEETASGADASKGVMGFARDILRMNEEYVGHGHNGRHTHTHARTHDRSGASTDSREQLMLGEEIGNEGTVAHAQTRPLHRTHWHSLRQAMLSAIATYTPPHVELTGAVLRRVHATHTVHVKPRKGLSAAESAVAMPTPVHVHGVLYNVPNLFMSRIRLCCKLVNGSTHCTALKPCALSGRTMTRDLDGEVASAQQHNNTISVTHHTQHSTHTTQGTQSTRVSGSSSEHEVVAFRVTESFHPARQKGKAKIHLTITMKYKNGEGLQRFLDTVKDLTSASALRQESPESDSIARTSTYRDELKLLGLHECTITISKQRSFQT
ncbi:hypothetical protein SARC_08547 [Sphaeroforma arctica JP610]|uniref:Condensin complex subunit 1 C-terminal domain-containing protein n=1 Tax=Sphaeroforma arctica JP610 TaxID=667725 RepID=A0A0L0FQR2_9EUKA|nr:hypothetical protein SARC_08547 [Sphaeroforma arctica JP610]KNC79049.1 hypothetical protein SARC_08547 [Sphaeroforma arctica JP610]|eukprot:XP_014152951.1 hypothetical protein SARC_08547 [Sphaeroforma arctica JP610]